MYRLIYGLPSDVKSTSLLESIINLLALGYCVGRKKIKESSFVVDGNDFIITFNKSLNDVGINRIQARVEVLGTTFKFLERKDIRAKNIHDRPCFYKSTI